jgi:CheY-like chemotaxis protein
MLKALENILASEGGFTVVGRAADGRQELRDVLALAPDLVLMDLHLPCLNGDQTTDYIKQFVDPPLVFIVTGNESPSAREICAAAGADAFIVKSADFRSQLKFKLQEWFGIETDGRHHSKAPLPEGEPSETGAAL